MLSPAGRAFVLLTVAVFGAVGIAIGVSAAVGDDSLCPRRPAPLIAAIARAESARSFQMGTGGDVVLFHAPNEEEVLGTGVQSIQIGRKFYVSLQSRPLVLQLLAQSIPGVSAASELALLNSAAPARVLTTQGRTYRFSDIPEVSSKGFLSQTEWVLITLNRHGELARFASRLHSVILDPYRSTFTTTETIRFSRFNGVRPIRLPSHGEILSCRGEVATQTKGDRWTCGGTSAFGSNVMLTEATEPALVCPLVSGNGL